jgi:Mn-dependent DtxR family transcriptional regulator
MMAQQPPVTHGKDRDEESGRYTDTYTEDDLLEAIRDLGGMAGTSDVAGHVGCARDTAYKKLKQMEEDGTVSSRKVGGALLWSVEG